MDTPPIALPTPILADLSGGVLAPDGGTLERQRGFARALNIADRRIDAGQQTPEGEARSAAERFVSATFIEPLLKQLRATNQAAAPFAPGPAEKQFGALMDSAMAHEMVKAARFPLVERLARDLLRETSPAPSAPPSPLPGRDRPTLTETHA